MKRHTTNIPMNSWIKCGIWAVGTPLMIMALLLGLSFMSERPETVVMIESPTTAHASLPDRDHGHNHQPTAMADGTYDENPAKKQYVCPMMCVPPTDRPGRCPVCGMALTPVETQDRGSAAVPARLQLSSEAVHLAEIQTVPVTRKSVTSEVRLFGRIDYDSAHTTEITAFMPGVIDRVYVKRAGQFVRWGDPLFDIYSSDLLDTQRQLVDAMQYVPGFLAFQANTPHVAQDVPVQVRKKESAKGGYTPAQKDALQQIKALRHKLSILGLPKRDIDQFMKKGEATGIATVYAPMYGQISTLNATEGAFVNTGVALFTIADPQYVWARLDAYESDYPWIRIGQRVTFTSEAYPGEVFESKVVYIDPVFDPVTRTFSIGAITTDDQGGRLKAGMLVRATAHARLDATGQIAGANTSGGSIAPLVIPATAPLITGRRTLVYVSVGQGSAEFEGREILLGPRAKDHYVVYGGLTEGEQVVVNGNFKIDSAMQIQAKSSLMSPSGGVAPKGHDDHGGATHEAPTPMPKAHRGMATATPAVKMSSANAPFDAEHTWADDHQHPNLSDQMHDHFTQQRLISRTENKTNDSAHSAMNHNVTRRKPGRYGDTTRQGKSQLEEHRRKWR